MHRKDAKESWCMHGVQGCVVHTAGEGQHHVYSCRTRTDKGSSESEEAFVGCFCNKASVLLATAIPVYALIQKDLAGNILLRSRFYPFQAQG
jgi:hypothetical protein